MDGNWNSYKAVYYVEPQTTDHPTYQINRKIVVKEADQQKDSQSESSSDQDAGSSDETETEDSEAGSSTEETGDAKTESKTELTEKEFDAEIEATENQETVDPETGITLSEVMQEAVDQEVALADLEAGESITFDMPMMLASGETGTKSVTVTAGSWYYYADYGLGSYLTCPYYVKWGSINATAYCVEPSKKGPGNGTYTIQKLADGKTLAKVCYYGTKASDENDFFDEKHPDFPAGKRFIITHLAAAYANESSDWASGTNATGKNLAMELYNYCVNMPDIPSVDMSFSETGNEAQGDATLEGAVYGLYAREDIVHPDGRTGTIYKKDTLITSLTTDKNGEASVSDLYLGKYYLKELSAPVGYVLDPTEHDVDCTYEGATVPTVERTSVCKETVIKQPFQIIKAANNGKTDADLLQGVGFSAWLVSDLKVKADGSYDFDSARPVVLTADGQTEMFTDEKGYAKSIPLPYGTYVVRETTSKHNYAPVDDFVVKITENHPDTPQTWRVLLDKEFKAKLKIIKKDAETQKSVLLANTEFKVYDLDNQKYVEQTTSYPKPTVHKSYFTNEEGYLVLPKNLKPGNYRIEEVTAPDGYTISKNYVTVAVDTDTAYLTDPVTGDAVIDVEYTNAPVKGQLKIYKQGEMLKGFDKDFQYEMAGLAGAEFEVYAAEDIYTADHQVDADGQRTLYFAKDALVATVTTDADGYATVKNLPLGRYYVKEKNAPDTYVLNTVPENVEFAYADQDTAVIEKEISVTDERQKVSITVEKQDAEIGNTVAGAVFGIYNAKDIQTKDGKVIVKADTLLQEMTSDEKGQSACTLDLPLGGYYVKELKAPDGFVSSDEVLRFDASYQGQDVQTVTLKSVKKNQPTTVEITKSDATTGVELDGAYLKVTDKDGNIVDSWTSSKDAPHVIKYLKVGETYTLHEEFAPHGYLVANDVTFTVKDTGEVQKVEMKDEVPVGELIINKKGEFLDSVTLADKVKGVVEHIFNYVTGKLTDVTFEVYAEEDIKAADGVSDDYYKKDELIATIKTDETGIAKLENLPLGKYYVKETGTAYGHVLDGEIRHVDLTYVDQDTPVVVYDKDWQNNRQRVEVSVLKKEKDSDRTLEGAIFGLFAKEDIKSETTGKVLIEADEIIELKSTDEEGKITFVADLPIGATYYVKELYAPDGFVTNDEEKEFTFEYAGEEQPTVTYDFTFENQPTVVEFTKSSLTTGKELPGCKLKVVDADGNIVDEWTSLSV